VDVETEAILQLLSERARAEMDRTAEYQFILRQLQYTQQVIREGFEDISTRISELEDIVLSDDHRHASLRRQLAANLKTLNALQEERAQRAGEINVALHNRIETLRTEIENIKQELGIAKTIPDG